MVINHIIFNNTLTKILVFCLLSIQSVGQKPITKSAIWNDNWKIELKTGVGALLTPVPDQYLKLINNVNIPLNTPGPLVSFSLKKAITPHFEMGYQYDYIRIQGKVKVENMDIEVLTKAYTHNYLIQYNFKKTYEYKPAFNYFIYYRIGGISLKNTPLDQIPDGPIAQNNSSVEKLLTNIAVLTSFGTGINHQLNHKISLTGTFDLNRSSDAIEDIYKIHKIFYHSSHTVNSYIALSFGLIYSFDLIKKDKSIYFKPSFVTEKRIKQFRKEQRKSKTSGAKHPLWYNSKKGR